MGYWEERAEQLVNKQIKADDKAAKKLAKEYARVAAKLEKEVAAYYTKYSKDSVIEFRDMLGVLSESERTLLYENLDAFAQAFPQYAHLLPVRRSIYKLNRLEGLQLSAQLELYRIGAIEEEVFKQHLTEAYERGYLYTLQGLPNTQSQFVLNAFAAQQALDKKWLDNNNFSDRIWGNKNKLLSTLRNEIRDGMIRGDTYNSMIKTIRYRTGVGAFDARRLIHTESAFISVQANAHAFQSVGIERYEICAVMDRKTSQICRSLDGTIFYFNEAAPGTNMPPFHAFCRTTIVPIENDAFVSRI